MSTQPEPAPARTAMALFIDQPWVDQALCAQTDPELWFPEKGGATHVAKATCAQCFVQAECLDYALTTNERFGVWGGLSERERRAINAGTTNICPDCGDLFYNQGGYSTHQRTHRLDHLNTERTVS